jgi:DNA-binding Lrp family transcriptional regulator
VKEVRPQVTTLDEVDRAIIRMLARDARTPNSTLAASVGIAPSTCLERIRRLRTRGVIKGYHAQVDPRALGQDIQAMVAVRMHSSARAQIAALLGHLTELPGVLNVYFVSGANDFQVHVAVATTDELRAFVVDHLSSMSEVASTETSLIFEHRSRAFQHSV